MQKDKEKSESKSNSALTRAQQNRSKCMQCENAPIVDLQWADGNARAWFCYPHVEKFLQSEGRAPIRAYLSDGKVGEKSGQGGELIWENNGNDLPEEDLLSLLHELSLDVNRAFNESDGSADVGEVGKLLIYLPFKDNEVIKNIQALVNNMLADVFYAPAAPDSFHLTLLWVENVSDAQIKEMTENIIYPSEFSISLDFLGTFVEAEGRPLVLRVQQSEALLSLQAAIVSAATQAGIVVSKFSSVSNYSPHITIGEEVEEGMEIPEFAFHGTLPVSRINFARENFEDVKSISLKDVPLKLLKRIMRNLNQIINRGEENGNAET